jgi:PIN domain nuclease of toxin-antitoxin system
VHSVYVSDTHPLLWHMASDARLSAAAQKALAEVDSGHSELFVPAVVVAEMYMAVERKRVPVQREALARVITQWRKAPNIRLSDLTSDLVEHAMNLTAIPDIFDRLIVAETLERGAVLITKDSVISDSKLVPVVW